MFLCNRLNTATAPDYESEIKAVLKAAKNKDERWGIKLSQPWPMVYGVEVGIPVVICD